MSEYLLREYVCVCECGSVHDVHMHVCAINRCVCVSINVSPESMEPIWGETNLPPTTGEPGTARTP